MSGSGPDRLYELLPALYRARDFDQGEPLRALLGVMGEEYDRLRASIQALEASWFVEICDPKVIPFIADLAGVPREDLARVPPRTQRAFVGNAIRFRRRKGIASVLERAIGDATGWTAHAVEMFEHVGVTQNVEHPSPSRGRLFDVRSTTSVVPEPGVGIGSYTADVRGPNADGELPSAPGGASGVGPRRLTVYVSRLQSYPVEWSEPFRVKKGCYTFHPLGLDTPLFTQPISDDHPLRPHDLLDLAASIPPGAFAADLAAYASLRAAAQRIDPLHGKIEAQNPASWFGTGKSIDVKRGAGSIDPITVVARDLRGWEPPAPGQVAIDVALGRLAFPPGDEPEALRTSWSFGRVDDVGAGPYPRDDAPDVATWRAEIAKVGTVADPRAQSFRSLRDAVHAWNEAVARWDPKTPPIDGLIRIFDSSTYAGALSIQLGVHGLRIEAEEGEVPTLASPIEVRGDKGARMAMAGLTLGAGLVYGGRMMLALASCTVRGAIEERDPRHHLPGFGAGHGKKRPDVVDLLASERVSLALVRCLTGPVKMAGPAGLVSVAGSIVDGGGGQAIGGLGSDPGPAIALSRSTVIGDVSAEVILGADECLFTGAVRARRIQPSVLRFSAVPYASKDLPRYRSVLFGAPGDATEAGAIAGEPRFTSLEPGHPAYGRLAGESPEEIRAGAEDGGEMGAFHDTGERLRHVALRAVLDDFLPHHLSAGVLFLD